MTFAARMQATAHRMISRFGDGGTVTLRRPHSLKSGATGGAPVLKVNGTTAAGESTINIDAVGLVGTMVAGLKFKIAGNATVYTTQADLDVVNGALTGVSIDPVLAAEAADDAAVTITQEYGEIDFIRVRDELTEADGVDLLDRNQRKVHLSALAESTAPEVGDILQDGDKSEYVQQVIEWAPDGDAVSWTVFVGDQPR